MGNQPSNDVESAPKGPIEEWIDKIASVPGVKAVIITDPEGLPLRDTFATWEAGWMLQYATLCSQFVKRAKVAVTTFDNNDELNLVRIRSKKDEVLVALDKDYILIVIQSIGLTKTDVPITIYF
jgi:dynein light chain roadblock-type|uniref:Roadblock/LAMTOR2 domain-containing protein n=1 Tax=Eutreptiella gymnastica TaxID=73025 RepID=A0A7S4LLC1_9EUGL|mmetsp:Transcript_59880/g.99333  ORF Transcript_59880/g.99333 Transcript_59880/m.99333 type:complete len:124 (+) Transcript_59880:81-452(+)|eukprot:CAMPEP_0174293084 /NCGR_PEP_ID=MMETSP0809-20121228/37421_1 /TAXON_ID=73025 ORGANISM="Eutreptiella gymnastica-like, Strain CCMP1594" /NCGR_SAMPLE_ID=MMETSP0809 /ASSEMBLY_ACC=CAM_ASM_000658 /LENGTH=123 /DNA_ID=CAMNT_0015393607 /DNA_START=83 /DNA_END=454 /DNA_ORIENTATION=-